MLNHFLIQCTCAVFECLAIWRSRSRRRRTELGGWQRHYFLCIHPA